MLVDEVSVLISGERHAKLVEVGDGAPELDPVHQEHCDWDTLLQEMPQEHLLEVLRPIWNHLAAFLFALHHNRRKITRVRGLSSHGNRDRESR